MTSNAPGVSTTAEWIFLFDNFTFLNLSSFGWIAQLRHRVLMTVRLSVEQTARSAASKSEGRGGGSLAGAYPA
eukprot:CAMPEP_0177607702 /NCGR_PEP_ID=MMETSP0419_2-20121207/18063_1 /TAXON_ID=582737 /ORGANISM="Tetraselmis sp., Strain GSL018" /LENGTH=72 /DNA_ID=CAMNT_0019102311 /DNA_START=569 /DNA_END=787 /DNA_ORIENTATION=+